MQLDKLFSKEDQDRIGNEMRHLYFDEGWSKEQLRLHYSLTHDTLKEFARKYDLVKTPSQYNKKGIDVKFSKEELDTLAENIRIDFCDNLLLEAELEEKYNITFTDLEHIKKRYNISETVEQHWKRTQRANMLKHGVSHMSHIEGSRKRSADTHIKNYEENLRKKVDYYKSIYGEDLDVEEFIRIRKVLKDRELIKAEVLKHTFIHRNYPYLSRIWHISDSVLMDIFDKFNLKSILCYNYGYSPNEVKIIDAISDKYPELELVLHDKTLIPPQELDIYMPEIQFAIEVNGTYWHCDKNVNVNYHQNKSKLCMEKGIQLFHAFEKDLDENFDNVLDKLCCLIDMLIRGNVEASSYYECDFCEDNGAALVKNGYKLESLSVPGIRYKFGEDNVYDAGKAIFRKD